MKILCIAGPTASGKSARAVAEALARNGEVISVDSRQVYRGLDIGTEKITVEEMRGVPHHLISTRSLDSFAKGESYSAGDFVADASRLIAEISTRGALPILAGGTHFYFDALLHGLPSGTPPDQPLRLQLEVLPTEELYARVAAADPRRAAELDPKNRRRLIRALEIIAAHGAVPPRTRITNGLINATAVALIRHADMPSVPGYEAEWIVLDPPMSELRQRIEARLASALERGLVDEVRRVRAQVGDARLNELGLEYRVVGEYLRGERSEASLLPTLTAKLAQYARRQKAWLRKLQATAGAAPRLGKS